MMDEKTLLPHFVQDAGRDSSSEWGPGVADERCERQDEVKESFSAFVASIAAATGSKHEL